MEINYKIDCKDCDKFRKTVLKIKEFTDAKELEIKQEVNQQWITKIKQRIEEIDKLFETQIKYLDAKRKRTKVVKKIKSYSEQMKRLTWNKHQVISKLNNLLENEKDEI